MPRRVQTGVMRTEDLVADESIAAVNALSRRRRQQQRDVVATLAVTGSEHFASRGFLQQPVEAVVAGPIEVGRQAGPIQVHIDGDRGGRGPVRRRACSRQISARSNPAPPNASGTASSR